LSAAAWGTADAVTRAGLSAAHTEGRSTIARTPSEFLRIASTTLRRGARVAGLQRYVPNLVTEASRDVPKLASGARGGGLIARKPERFATSSRLPSCEPVTS